MPKKKLKKEKVAFWKKSPELKSIADHIGKFIDRMSPSDVMDATLLGLLAWAGWETAGKLGGDITSQISGAGIGILGYKLATARTGNAIPVTQGAGLAILAGIGLISLGKNLPANPPYPEAIEWAASTEGQAALRAMQMLPDLMINPIWDR